MNTDTKFPIKKVNIICAKGAIEDVYATLVMGNGAVMEGIETNLFFTFFGLDAIVKNRMDKLHTGVVGNPALRLPGLGSGPRQPDCRPAPRRSRPRPACSRLPMKRPPRSQSPAAACPGCRDSG